MDSWNYTYENINDVFKYNQQNLPNVVSVLHVDDKMKLDTVDVTGNKAIISKNLTGVYLRGTGTDTIKITAQIPDISKEILTIFNQTNFVASLNGIVIPAGLGLTYQYVNGKWFYQNPITVPPNNPGLPRSAFIATLIGTATDTIRVTTTQLDTTRIKIIRVYNKSNFTAYCNFNAAMNALPIPPGYGRNYELINGNWRMYNNRNVLLTTDPYIEGLALGSTNYSIERYAKNIGLVYKELLMWEFQATPGGQGGSLTGFGVKLTMIDHN
jgi:hypothetical protein